MASAKIERQQLISVMLGFPYHAYNSMTDHLLIQACTCYRTDMETLFSVEEAARRLGGVSKWTIHAWLSQGKLQRTKVGGRTMIRESELEKVIEEGGKSPAPKRSTNQK